MNSYLVLSIDPLGATIVTRHFTPLMAEAEKLRRFTLGHAGIAMQESEWEIDGLQTCLLRNHQGARRLHRGTDEK